MTIQSRTDFVSVADCVRHAPEIVHHSSLIRLLLSNRAMDGKLKVKAERPSAASWCRALVGKQSEQLRHHPRKQSSNLWRQMCDYTELMTVLSVNVFTFFFCENALGGGGLYEHSPPLKHRRRQDTRENDALAVQWLINDSHSLRISRSKGKYDDDVIVQNTFRIPLGTINNSTPTIILRHQGS